MPPRGNGFNFLTGRNLEGWTPKIRYHELGDNFANTFRVEDGLLKVAYDGYDEFNETFGHLFYKDKFSHYRIRGRISICRRTVQRGTRLGDSQQRDHDSR